MQFKIRLVATRNDQRANRRVPWLVWALAAQVHGIPVSEFPTTVSDFRAISNRSKRGPSSLLDDVVAPVVLLTKSSIEFRLNILLQSLWIDICALTSSGGEAMSPARVFW